MKIALLFVLAPFFLFGQQADCRALFSQKDLLADHLILQIDEEQREIKMTASALSHLRISKALVRAINRGVDVEVLVDPRALRAKKALEPLLEAKIPLYVWDETLKINPSKRKARMHNCFCVFGKETVWTGSFVYTNDSNLRHVENALLIKSPEIAAQFLSQFAEMKIYQSRPFEEYIALSSKRHSTKKRN